MNKAVVIAGIFALAASPLAADTFAAYNQYTNQPSNMVSTHPSTSDAQLESNVRQTLKNARFNQDFPHVKVRADNGTITLSGYVDSQSDKMVIESKVANTQGVQNVDNKIKVLNAMDDQSLQDIESHQNQNPQD